MNNIKASAQTGAFLSRITGAGAAVNGSVEYRSLGEDMPRKPVYRRLTGNPFGKGKEASCFPCPPARIGSGKTRDTGQGTRPLRGSGWNPEMDCTALI